MKLETFSIICFLSFVYSQFPLNFRQTQFLFLRPRFKENAKLYQCSMGTECFSQLEEEWVYLGYRLYSILKGSQSRNLRQTLGQRQHLFTCLFSTAFSVCFFFKYKTPHYLPRGDTSQSGLVPPTSVLISNILLSSRAHSAASLVYLVSSRSVSERFHFKQTNNSSINQGV